MLNLEPFIRPQYYPLGGGVTVRIYQNFAVFTCFKYWHIWCGCSRKDNYQCTHLSSSEKGSAIYKNNIKFLFYKDALYEF